MSVITGNRYATDDSDMRETNVNVKEILDRTGNPIDQVYSRPTYFEISTEITRPANTTAYIINEIVNTDALSVLPTLDFTSLGSVIGRAIQINSVSLVSSYGAATTKLNPIIHLFNANTITGQTITDSTVFNPSYAELKAKRVMTFENCTILTTHGSGAYMLTQTEIMRNCTLDSTGKLYLALITNGAYTPASGEKITVSIKGYLL